MTAATIPFTDIVAFSKKPTTEQRQLVESITAEVRIEIGQLLAIHSVARQVVALPTGDGLALAFLHSDAQTWNHSTVLRLALRLHRWAFAQSNE
ncbi:MAG: hypothetical protein KJZ92_03450 [Rhodocyclaceae bacterium]|nr:hypothetical protein [Rhodocyclaceae bacterium]